MNYVLFTIWEGLFNRQMNQIKQIVNKVVSRPESANATVRADLQNVPTNPYNLVGSNITSIYGGRATKENWHDSASRPLKVAKRRKSDYWTSCDEDDQSGTLQRYDDDKLELTCFEHWYNIMFFRQSRLG